MLREAAVKLTMWYCTFLFSIIDFIELSFVSNANIFFDLVHAYNTAWYFPYYKMHYIFL